MKNKNSKTIPGMVLVVLCFIGLFYFIAQLINIFNELSDQLKASTIQVIGIVSVALITYFANKSLERKRVVESSLREEKRKMYDEYIKFYFRVFSGDKVNDKPSEAEMTKFFVEKNPTIVTYASNSVIKEVGKMRLRLSSNPESMFVVENVLKEMRKDLGHSSSGLDKADILRLFINDIDDYLTGSKVTNQKSGGKK